MMNNKNGVDEESGFVRVFTSTPKEKFVGQWERGRLYPLYNVVENNGSKFMSLTGKMKEEPYVSYNKDTNTFSANDGWILKEMSADSRISAFGGSGSGVTPEEMQAALAGKQDVISDLSSIRTGAGKGSTAYQKPSAGIPKNDLSSGVKASLDKADSALQSGDVPEISTDISTDASSDTKAASPKAVKTYVDNNSSPDAVKYVSQSLTTEQKAQARTNIGAASSSDLSAKQDALVSGTNIKTINQTSILGSGDITIEDGADGKSAYDIWISEGNEGDEQDFLESLKGEDGQDGDDGEDGVGFASVASPTPADGTVEITLSNGDTITLDLNHNHPQYLKYVMLENEGDMPASPDSTTLYMWPEE